MNENRQPDSHGANKSFTASPQNVRDVPTEIYDVCAAMPAAEWERRVMAAAAECKADTARYPNWNSWRMNDKQRRELAS